MRQGSVLAHDLTYVVEIDRRDLTELFDPVDVPRNDLTMRIYGPDFSPLPFINLVSGKGTC